MRSEQQMFDLILETAKCDDRIRAVIMNGSRANPNAPRDPFQDFDIVYIVTDVEPFRHNLEWIQRFGEMMILQMPDEMQDPPPDNGGSFAYLMQFVDGNRIDLGLFTFAQWKERGSDSQSVLLLDKDGIIEPFPPASDSDYFPEPPTAKAFFDCCNEFWWVSPYAAKGLWRQEILYAKYIQDVYVRDQLMKMLMWHIGVKTDFKVSPGKLGKYFQKYLEPELWDMLLKTYSDASYENTWEALFTMCELFRTVAVPIAENFGFEYPFEDDKRVTAHLEYVRALPGDAKEIYPEKLS
jgi:aminoglycoside 6-adenylyltransferase